MEVKEMNIFQKLEAITNELGFVAKNLNVAVSKSNSYKATGEVDVLEAVKPLENKYGVFSYAESREIVESDTLVQNTQYGEKTNLYLRIKVVYKFVNVDNPSEFITTVSYADGIDSGDKACGKAMTYADKYALMKAYKISTGEDPDQTASGEYQKGRKATRKGNMEQTKEVSEKQKKVNFIMEFYTMHKEKFTPILKGVCKGRRVGDLTDLEINSLIELINESKQTLGGGTDNAINTYNS